MNKTTSLHVAVLGAGALGCAIGGVLAEAGHKVWLVNRNAAHVQAMQERGLILRDAGEDRRVAVHAVRAASEIRETVDLVIVLVKSFHTRDVMASALHLLGSDTVVVSLQNGLGHEDILAELAGRERVMAGKTYVGGTLIAPGHVLVGTRGKETILGELDGAATDRVQRISAQFTQAGLQTTVSPNIMCTMWDKLFVNVATGALSTITRQTYGVMYQIAEIEACAIAAVSEAMAVARASGVAISTTDPKQAWDKAAAGLPFEFKTSMLQSFEKGSVTEIDYINGAVVRWGERCGVPTPVNRTLVACIKGIEHGLRH
jgi:2-dehydropantoate 2-reductase